MSFRRGKRIIQSQDDKGEKYIELGERLIPRGLTNIRFRTSSIIHQTSYILRSILPVRTIIEFPSKQSVNYAYL